MKSLGDILDILNSFKNRGIGKTTAITNLAKEINAIVVCFNKKEAKRVENEYGAKTIAINELERTKGIKNPVIFDPDTYNFLLLDINHYIDELKEEIKDLKELMNDKDKKIDFLLDENISLKKEQNAN